MSIIFQALKYDAFDHAFTNDGDDEEPLPSGGKANAKQTEWASRLQHQRSLEAVTVVFGNELNTGESVCIGIRNHRPRMCFLVSKKEAQDINALKMTLQALVDDIYRHRPFKRALQAHVFVDEVTIKWGKSIYGYQEDTSPFLEVTFRSSAAYNHLVNTMNAVKLAQRYSDETLATVDAKLNNVKHALEKNERLVAKKAAKKSKGKSADGGTADEPTVVFSDGQKENLAAKKEKLQQLRQAFVTIEQLSEATKSTSWRLFNSSLTPIVVFLEAMKSTTQWFEVPKAKLDASTFHSDDVEDGKLALKGKHIGVIDFDDLISRNDVKTLAPFMQCAFDIETYSSVFSLVNGNPVIDAEGFVKREFPDPRIAKNHCFQIAATFHRFGQSMDTFRRVLFTLGNPARLEAEDSAHPKFVLVIRCRDERDMLLRFFTMLDEEDVDVMYTYNGDGFDMGYLYHRAVYRGLLHEREIQGIAESKRDTDKCYGKMVESGIISDLATRLPGKHVKLEHSVFQSGGAGTNNLRRFVMPGRTHIDLQTYMKNNDSKLQK